MFLTNMKIIFILLIFILPNIASAKNLNFTKIVNLKSPWGSTFIDDNSILITEKSGAIKLINIKNNNPKKTIIGLGYAFQLTSENFAENHDLKFDTVFTELGGQHF